MAEAFVQCIETKPEAKTGEIILIADLADAFREGSTREPIGDCPVLPHPTSVQASGVRASCSSQPRKSNGCGGLGADEDAFAASLHGLLETLQKQSGNR
jgi:hypothetical protein